MHVLERCREESWYQIKPGVVANGVDRKMTIALRYSGREAVPRALRDKEALLHGQPCQKGRGVDARGVVDGAN
jgi:hypothetical protein